MKHHHPSTASTGGSQVDIRMTLTRNAADYFGTYGDLTFRATDAKINQQVGAITLKTIELPPGNYVMDLARGQHTYPLQTADSIVTDPLKRAADTSPRKLGAVWLFVPPKPPGVDQEDYDLAMDSSIYTQPKSVFTHSGLWSAHSLFCILVGGPYTQAPRVVTHAYPGIELNKTYLVRGFAPSVTLTQQLKMNLWVYSVEKLLKRPPTMRFSRTGAPRVNGPVPAPLDKLPPGPPRLVGKTR